MERTKEIYDRLAAIGTAYNVRILYAAEAGSRAWGFASQNSDYDVRFVYVRPLDDYLRLDEPRDVIEEPIADELDINGWDIRKALRLFRKGNPPMIEWLDSPFVYLDPCWFGDTMRAMSTLSFNPGAAIYHYLHMAQRNFNQYLQGDRIPVKKYFYVLRPLLACRWIEKHGSFPPLGFRRLVEENRDDFALTARAIDALLVRKEAGEEMDKEERISPIHTWIEGTLKYYEQGVGYARMSNTMTSATNDLLDLHLRSYIKKGVTQSE